MPRHTTRSTDRRTLTRPQKPATLRVEHLEDRVVPQAYVVTSFENNLIANGKVSLAEAIAAASTNTKVGDAAAGSPTLVDTIQFDLGAGSQFITLGGVGLPQLAENGGPLVIDGPDPSSGKAYGILGEGKVADGLVNQGKSSFTIRKLTLGGFTNAAIRGDGTGKMTVEGCFIGTDKNGSGAFANAKYGILLAGSQNSDIGGTSAAERNVIANNFLAGIRIQGTGTSGNQIVGNYIGLKPNGIEGLGNALGVEIADGASNNRIGLPVAGAVNYISGNSIVGGILITGSETQSNSVVNNVIGLNILASEVSNVNGVTIRGGASLNTVGGPNAIERNTIGGNTVSGVSLFDTGTTQNSIFGNHIGNVAGSNALPNGTGVVIGPGVTKTVVGGPSDKGFGNVISGNDFDGVIISGAKASSNTIVGNLIGTNAAGTAALPNQRHGVAIESGATNNTIGGTAANLINLISGNGQDGVEIIATGTISNVVVGNRIGTDLAGTKAIPNGQAGVRIAGGAVLNTIGLAEVGGANIISGNTQQGVLITGGGTQLNQVIANRIGLDANGAALGNAAGGVVVTGGAAGNTIGGAKATQRNFIGGNVSAGVLVSGAGTTETLIVGNFIGLSTNGVSARPNTRGVLISEGATKTQIGGPSGSGFGNVISGNAADGIRIVSSVGENIVSGNRIGTNATGTAALPNATNGVTITAGSENNIIGGTTEAGLGNLISGNGKYGIELAGDVTGSVIESNLIGTTLSGTTKLPNAIGGVHITNNSSNNTIGGSTTTPGTGAGNIISGNNGHGILLTSGANNNQVWGNVIGLGADGKSMGNTSQGVRLEGATNNEIGGTSKQQRNVIGGNGSIGVLLFGSTTADNFVRGNYIGVSVDGASARPNAGGIQLTNAKNNLVGGPGDSRNVISGSTIYGVHLTGTGATGNTVAGNYIGLAADGTTPLGNGTIGVSISGEANGNIVGGVTANLGNRIAHNAQEGIEVVANSLGNRILGNSIFSNGKLGIDLGGDGKTANDITDADVGPNRQQNYPAIATVTGSDTATTITGSIASVANTKFRIEFFANSEADASGYGEGKTYLGSVESTTNGAGSANFNTATLTALPTGTVTVTATATNLTTNDTSEFSQGFVLNDAPEFTLVPEDQTLNEGQSSGPLVVGISDTETSSEDLVLTAETSNPTLFPSGSIVLGGSGSNRTITLTPASGQTGSAVVTLTVEDELGATSTATFNVTVQEVDPGNTPPSISDVQDRTILVDTSTGEIQFTVEDEETSSDNLVVSASSSNTSLVASSGIVLGGTGTSRTVSITPEPGQTGTTTITLTVTDEAGATATDTFVITVAEEGTGNPPTISDVTDQTIITGQSTGPRPFTVSDEETSSDDLVVTVSSSNATLVPLSSIKLNGSGSDRFVTVTPIAGLTGTAIITLTVTDSSGLSASDTFELTVVEEGTGNPPTISDVTDQTIVTGQSTGPRSFTVSDTETSSVDLVVTATSSNDTLVPLSSIVHSGSGSNRTVTVTPVDGLIGTAVITLTVTDSDGLTATDTFTLTVVEQGTGDPPTISEVANRTLNVGQSSGPIAFTIGDTETSPSDLVVTAASSNSSLVTSSGIVLGGTGPNRTVSITPAPGQTGTTMITLTVTDSDGNTATESFTVNVQEGGTGPEALRRFTVGSGAGQVGTVSYRTSSGSTEFTLTPFESSFTGGVRVATGDFNGDGVADIAVGTGPGRITRVIVYDGVTKAELFSIQPFEDSFTGGVFIAAGDLNNDGIADLVITPDQGGGPRARVFSGQGFTQITDFFGIEDTNFRGGARAAIADVTGDGIGDLLVAAGFGGGPRLAVFNGTSLASGNPTKPFGDFFVFEPTLRNGVFVAGGDLNRDGFAEVIAGAGPGGGPRLFALDGQALLGGQQVVRANFFAGDVNNRGGVRVTARDLDGDGFADLIAGAGTGAGSRVNGYDGRQTTSNGVPPELFGFDAFSGFSGGVFVG